MTVSKGERSPACGAARRRRRPRRNDDKERFMTRHTLSRLQRATGFAAALFLTGALAAGAANSIRVPNGGNPEGGTKCGAENPYTTRFGQRGGAPVTPTPGGATPGC